MQACPQPLPAARLARDRAVRRVLRLVPRETGRVMTTQRKRQFSACLLLLFVLLTLASSASADEPWQPWTPSALVLSAAAAADADWQALGYAPVAVKRWSVVDDDSIVLFAASQPSVQHIIWNRGWLIELERQATSSTSTTWRRAALRQLCATMMHEKGHLLGFADYDPVPGNGIMTIAVWFLNPPKCTAWVNTLVPSAGSPPPPILRKGWQAEIDGPAADQKYRTRARKFAQLYKERGFDEDRAFEGLRGVHHRGASARYMGAR